MQRKDVMKKMKKIIALLCVSVLSIGFAGCEKGENNSTAEETAETNEIISDESEIISEENNDVAVEMPKAANGMTIELDGKCWIGTGAESAYVAAFSGDKIAVSAFEEGEKSEINGYWSIEDGELYIYGDKEHQEEIGLYGIKFPLDADVAFIKLNDVTLAPTESYSYDNVYGAVDNLSAVSEFVKAVCDDSIWFGESENSAYVFSANSVVATLYGKTSDGITINSDGYCAADETTMYFFNSNDEMEISYKWLFDGTTLSLKFRDDEPIEFTKSEITDIDEAISGITEKFSQ